MSISHRIMRFRVPLTPGRADKELREFRPGVLNSTAVLGFEALSLFCIGVTWRFQESFATVSVVYDRDGHDFTADDGRIHPIYDAADWLGRLSESLRLQDEISTIETIG